MSLSVLSPVLVTFVSLLSTTYAAAAEINCRYTAITPSAVNYYLCTDFSEY
jgi:hypothetical protein